jgi:hypothetical protein
MRTPAFHLSVESELKAYAQRLTRQACMMAIALHVLAAMAYSWYYVVQPPEKRNISPYFLQPPPISIRNDMTAIEVKVDAGHSESSTRRGVGSCTHLVQDKIRNHL